MAEKQIYHIKLHQGAWVWAFLGVLLIVMGAYLLYFGKFLNDELNSEEPAPYLLDLRNEGAPVSIDYINRWHIVATIERADGKEIRLYAPDTGKLVGTYWEPASAEAASDKDETGAE